MKKEILLLFCLFFLGSLCTAQSTFVKTLGGVENDLANSVIRTTDGNYLVIGGTSSFGSGEMNGYVAKVNTSAKVIWDKAIGSTSHDRFIDGIQLSDGDFILIGRSEDSSSGFGDILVTRMDNFGNVVWSKIYVQPSSGYGVKVIETSDGNILIAGHSFLGSDINALILKITKAGQEIWIREYKKYGAGTVESLGLIEDSSGNYLLSGEWMSGPNPEDTEAGLLTLSSTGDFINFNSYSSNTSISFNGFLKNHGSGFLNFGSSWTENNNKREIVMTELAQDGSVNWSKAFGITDRWIIPTSVMLLENGNYLITAFESESNPAIIDNGLMIEVSDSGDILWSKSYGDSGYDELKTVIEINDGLLAFGNTNSFGEGASDIFVVRTDNLGNVSGCSTDIDLMIRDVIFSVSSPSPVSEILSFGDPFLYEISNADFEENVICDGCNSTDLVAGLFCETAPIICSIDCLDGFTGTLPADLLLPQPERLCSDGGTPNNASWFAFVAGSNTIDLSIIPSNCTTIYDSVGTFLNIGIQASVYEDCSFENSIVCQTNGCWDMVAETLNLASDQYIEGQTYFLLIDGCGGSVCDYEVVVNSAQQAFEMDEITTVSNDLNIDTEVDTLCLGAEIAFTLDNFDQKVNFNWSIDPPTPEYPSGVHPVVDTNTVLFQFSEAGCYDIHVYAYNECDNSETKSFSICVEPLKDEVFSDIYVCQECFPITLVAPESGCIITQAGGAPTVLIEDPNGDGVPGWLGTTSISGPGLDSNMVTNNFGCTYKQYVNVVEIPLSPREQIDTFVCLEDFPVDIHGSVFSFSGESRNVTIEGGAFSGCDSLMNITVNAIDFTLGFDIGNCETGEVELAAIIANTSFSTYDSIIYTWYDEDLNIVLDNDGIDSILVVMGVGTYSVKVEVAAEGVSCPMTFESPMIDVDNLAPSTPTVTYAPIEICVSEQQAIIYVANQNLGENYVWTFTPTMPYSEGLTSDTVYVDVTNGLDFQFCVQAVNGCGTTGETCDQVIVIESPDSEFVFDSEICLDSLALIAYSGTSVINSSSDFNWDFDGGVIMNGMDPNSAGPFEIAFPSTGLYTISLILSDSGCSSSETTYDINVFEPFSPPTIDCERNIGSVTFTWDDTDVDDLEIIITTGQTNFELVDNTYTINGLNSEEEVIIQLIFNQNEICGSEVITENCTSLPCPGVVLEASFSDQDICIESGTDVLLEVDIMGDNSGVWTWNSPFIYDDNLFDIDQAGIGEHLISYTYLLGDCTFTIDTSIILHPSPDLDTDIHLSFCEEMGSNLVDILTSTDNTVLLDDEIIIDLEDVEVDLGPHSVTVTNPEGCSSTLDFTIESFGVESLLINGDSSIIQGESRDYTATFDSDLEDLILVWTLNEDTICVNCADVTISPDENSELCVSIDYGSGCTISDCMLIEINERTELFIPNAFSPNNDNINDLFAINSNNSLVFVEEIMIFDRWGEMVYNKQGFDLSEESFYWDGRKNGDFCAEGVYVYIISYLDEENQKKKIVGDLTLVR